MSKKYQLVGEVFGRLTVVEETDRDPKYPTDRMWLCRCVCGGERKVRTGFLNSGKAASCGCMNRERIRRFSQSCRKGCGGVTGSLWHTLKTNASRRGLTLSLTPEQAWLLYLKQCGRCALSNLPIELPERGRRHTASLDRKDNSLPYTLDNVWWVHKDVNFMKRDHTLERFLALCHAVTAHSGGAR